MLISDKMNQAMNQQIGSELGASNQYLQLASYFAGEDLPELEAFFFRQSDEERAHAMKFVHYILDAGGKVMVPALEAAPREVDSAEQAVQMALDWEKTVTEQINSLQALATQEGDYAAQGFLNWFSTEQIEEVSSMGELLRTIQRAGDQLLLVEDFVSRRVDPHA
ncbi:MAG: ferritin [Anaerolineae bacterium]|nr:MAG: ferritin [Anaerolineae bacterium]